MSILIFGAVIVIAGLYIGTFFYGWHSIAAESKDPLYKLVVGFIGAYLLAGMICFIITTVRLILKKPIISDRSLEKRLLAKYG